MTLFSTSHLSPSTLDLIKEANILSTDIDWVSLQDDHSPMHLQILNDEFDLIVAEIIPLVAPNNVDEYVKFPQS